MWIRVFPDVPYTKKWLEMPMGTGKGEVAFYQARIKKWWVIFEVSGLDRATAQEAFNMAWYKLPMKIRLVEKGEMR
jgi:large subunit ribosomal protein L16